MHLYGKGLHVLDRFVLHIFCLIFRQGIKVLACVRADIVNDKKNKKYFKEDVCKEMENSMPELHITVTALLNSVPQK